VRLACLCSAWLAGVGLAMWTGSPWVPVVAIAVLAAACLVAVFAWRRRALLVFLCLVALLGGVVRFQSDIGSVDVSTLRFYNESGPVHLIGVVASDPEPADDAVELRLDIRELDPGDGWRSVSGSALVYAPRYPAEGVLPADVSREPPFYRYGDLLEVQGELRTPPMVRDFDWASYLARKDITSVLMHPGDMELLATGQGFKPQEWVYSVRSSLSRSLDEALAEPQASVAQAVLLGKRSGIPDELTESFSRTGMSHVVAVSGLHVGILAVIAISFGSWVFGRRRPTYFLLAIAVIWLYATLTGLHAPAVRAAIMASLWLTAGFIGRPGSALPALLLAAAIMAGIHPPVLGDVSFQLSFAAMGGLVLLYPGLQSLGRRALGVAEEGRSLKGVLVDSCAVTVAAVIATLPIIAFYFHTVSLVTLPANLVALPALPGVIVSAALVGLVGLVSVPLAQVLGWVSWILLSYVIEVVEFFARLPFASVEADVGAGFVWGYYAVLGTGLLAWRARDRLGVAIGRLRPAFSLLSSGVRRIPAAYVVGPLLVCCALVWTAAATTPDGRLHVFFLDVSQGDAILIQKGHTQVLVDGGPDPEDILVELGDRLPFWDRDIELAVLTHPDADHITGMVEVLRVYGVDHALTSGQESGSAVYAEWARLVESRDIPQTVACAGQAITLGDDLRLQVLHPDETLMSGTYSDVNNNSVVLRLEYGDFSLMLTGDIFDEAECDLVEGRWRLRSTVLKVAHHGSATSSCEEFLGAVSPQIAVISVGRDNDFGHPSPDVVARLEEVAGGGVLSTADRGTIELITDGDSLWLRTER